MNSDYYSNSFARQVESDAKPDFGRIATHLEEKARCRTARRRHVRVAQGSRGRCVFRAPEGSIYTFEAATFGLGPTANCSASSASRILTVGAHPDDPQLTMTAPA